MDHAADIRAWLAPHADDMAALVEQLVAVATENRPGHALGTCGRLLCEAIAQLGLAAELIVLEQDGGLDEPCIVRCVVGDGAPTVYFHGHFDVVPAQDAAQFHPRRRDGRIVGRGTADMKGGLVSMLYGAAAARQLGLLDRGRIVLHLVCDEETGSAAGSGHLRRSGMIDRDAPRCSPPSRRAASSGTRAAGLSPSGSRCADARRTLARRISA